MSKIKVKDVLIHYSETYDDYYAEIVLDNNTAVATMEFRTREEAVAHANRLIAKWGIDDTI